MLTTIEMMFLSFIQRYYYSTFSPTVNGIIRGKYGLFLSKNRLLESIEICLLTCYAFPNSLLKTLFNLKRCLFKVCGWFPSSKPQQWCHGDDLTAHTLQLAHVEDERESGVWWGKRIMVPVEATLSTYIAIKPRTQWTSSSVKSVHRSYKRIYGLCNGVW